MCPTPASAAKAAGLPSNPFSPTTNNPKPPIFSVVPDIQAQVLGMYVIRAWGVLNIGGGEGFSPEAETLPGKNRTRVVAALLQIGLRVAG